MQEERVEQSETGLVWRLLSPTQLTTLMLSTQTVDAQRSVFLALAFSAGSH